MAPLALVTGASSGIGATFARALAWLGYDLVLVARRKPRLEELADELRTVRRVAAEVLAADLADAAQLARVEERVASEPRLEFLVNNAGFGALGRFFETGIEPHDLMHRLHVIATMRLTHAALRGMVPRRRGAIINVSSVAAFAPAAGSVSYTATKAWINTFTEALYLELRSARCPVRVQALCPGFTYSEFHDVAGMDRATVPKGWWMKAEDVVAESFRGLERNKLFVIPGVRYRMLSAILRHIPRGLYHAGSLVYSRRMRRELPPPAAPKHGD